MHYWRIAAVAFLFIACGKIELGPEEENSSGRLVSAGEEVETLLNIDVLNEDEAIDGKATKAVIDQNTTADIHNIWVAQYDGTSSGSVLMGHPTYLESSDFSVSGTSVIAKIKLLSTPSQSTVFFIANTFDKGLAIPKTLGEMAASGLKANKENELMGYDGTDYHIMFSGWKVLSSVQSGTALSVELRRNIAKVTLRVVNSSHTASSKVKVESVNLESVLERSYFFPTYGSPSLFPASGSLSVRSGETRYWPSGKAQGSAEVSEDFVFYVPVNKRGTVTNTDESAKNKYAPANATYAVINCTYRDAESGTDIPLSYKVFLGKNMKNDFNVESNTSNIFTIKIKSKGNSNLDSRITDYGPVDFTPASISRANCYILNPPTSDNYWRTFSIPVDRVDTFWGKGYTSTTAPYEYEPNYTLSPSNQWIAQILWSDFDVDPLTNFRFVGGGVTYEGVGLAPIKVQVPKGVSGNVVITIKRKDLADCPVLWSWHLWITDYNPDDAVKLLIPSYTVFDYPVSGGRVNRLEKAPWNTADYLNSYVMDRNLGALSAAMPAAVSSRGVLYYQHGRKDPFWYENTTLKKVANNDPRIQDSSGYPVLGVRFSIHNPDTYIIRSGDDNDHLYTWTLGNKYNPLLSVKKASSYKGNIWNDPNATGKDYSDSGNHKKSLFDPCPPGWRVPELGTYKDSMTSSSFLWTGNGRLYEDVLFFPAVGSISASGSKPVWGGAGLYVYSSDNASYTWAALRMRFTATELDHSNNTKNQGWTVRCIYKSE